MTDRIPPIRIALQNASIAYRKGDYAAVRRWAEEAAALDPHREEPWLWLASVSNPRESIEYLKRALEINPKSERARRAMDWAVKRYRLHPGLQPSKRPIVDPNIPSSSLVRPAPKASRGFFWLIVTAMIILLGGTFLFSSPGAPLGNAAAEMIARAAAGVDGLAGNAPQFVEVSVSKATRTPTPTPTPTLTPTPTSTPTLTPTPTATATPTFTATPTVTATPTEVPTDTPVPPDLPEGVSWHDAWIDINLSEQMAYAYIGPDLVRSFLVSTGTWQHPTVTGTYNIYVKYRYTDMSGPGYWLPDVPYVMYFYKGYGLHGTYWHSNFGVPMSHGCVNFSTPDAEWVFSFVEVGTVVNVHY